MLVLHLFPRVVWMGLLHVYQKTRKRALKPYPKQLGLDVQGSQTQMVLF